MPFNFRGFRWPLFSTEHFLWKKIAGIQTIGYFLLFIGCLLGNAGCKSAKLIPEAPLTGQFSAVEDIPSSVIDLPIAIGLKPLFEAAEAQVSKVFTSPGWPKNFVEDGCDTRYQYYFRRGPLRIEGKGKTFSLGFTGFYKIKAQQRPCLGETPIAGWLPPCSCGFDEPERRVQIAFSAEMSIQSDYSLLYQVKRMEPVAVDRCKMCFIGYDATKTVMDAIKVQLDSSRMYLEDTLSKVKLRPYFQQAWQLLQQNWDMAGKGNLKIYPEQISLSDYRVTNDSLFLNLGVTARPEIRLEPFSNRVASALPDLSPYQPTKDKGFSIHLQADLQYDSLSKIVTENMKGTRIDLDNGPVKKYMVVDNIRIYGGGKKLIIALSFSGSEKGVLYLTGQPHYDREKMELTVKDLAYDLRTQDFILKSAKWLFNKKILQVLQKYARFDAKPWIQQLKDLAGPHMNQRVNAMVKLQGGIDDFYISAITPLANHLQIRTSCTGNMALKISYQ